MTVPAPSANWRFQFTAARRRLLNPANFDASIGEFQFTAARRRLLVLRDISAQLVKVSIHSRPKATARTVRYISLTRPCFNSQPPEGGCGVSAAYNHAEYRFNSQPPEGGCGVGISPAASMALFQFTAARRRLPRLRC